MRIRKPGTWIVAAGGLLVALVPAARARASCGWVCNDEWPAIVAIGAASLLAPSEIGAAMPTAEPSTARFVLGWSWQIPIGVGTLDEVPWRHRLVPSLDVLPHPGGASFRGRLGYRYGRRHLFAGAGVGVDAAGTNLSPELGVKFLHDTDASRGDALDLSLHLLARAEIDPQSGHLRGGTILLGWNFL